MAKATTMGHPGRDLLASFLVAATLAGCSWKSLQVSPALDASPETAPTGSTDAASDPPDAPDAQVERTPEAADDRTSEAGSEVAVDRPPEVAGDGAGVEVGRCMRPLADVSATCPATYDLVPARACAIAGQDGGTSALTCGGLMIFAAYFIFERYVCYYDATSRALVALSRCTDTSPFCDNTQPCFYAGQPAGACEVPLYNVTPMQPSACPDGGAPDHPSPDGSGDASPG